MDDELIQKMQTDCELVHKHVIEMEELGKRRFKAQTPSRSEKMSKRDADKDSLIEGAEDEEGNGERDDDNASSLRQMVVQQLPDDATCSSLPEIDISEAMSQVNEYKQKMDQALDRISAKVDVLHQQARDIGDTLDRHNKILDNLDSKTDKNAQKLEQTNKRLEKQITAVSSTTIYIVVIAGLILMIILIIVVYVLCIQLFNIGGPKLF